MHMEYVPRTVALPPEILTPSIEAVLKKTSSVYWVEDGDEVLAWVGFMQETLLTNDTYVWVVLDHVQYTLRQLREARRVMTQFFSNYPSLIWAEADPVSEVDNKFLTFMNFTLSHQYEGRNVYKWRTH